MITKYDKNLIKNLSS